MTPDDLQVEVAAWHRRNWPDLPPGIPAAKVAEESGEVCGAVVKMWEGRRTVTDVENEAGDVVIALAALADRIGFDLWLAVERRWRDDVRHRHPQ